MGSSSGFVEWLLLTSDSFVVCFMNLSSESWNAKIDITNFLNWKSNSLILKIIHLIKKLDKSTAQWSITNSLLTTKKQMASDSAK
jgi:hypothetical protein